MSKRTILSDSHGAGSLGAEADQPGTLATQ